MNYSIKEINTIISGTLFNDYFLHKKIDNIHFDSRLIKNNGAFVALTIGERDGHDFIESAISNGARLIIVSNENYISENNFSSVSFILVNNTLEAFQKLAFYHRKQLNIPVIAITGSNGKTTTKDITSHLLSSKFNVFKTHKNFNNHIGVPLSLLQIKPEHDVAVLELGMNHKGEIDSLAKIVQPDFSIITNIGESHIENLGSRENIAHAKGELLPYTKKDGYALLPFESEFYHLLSSKYNGNIVSFSTKRKSDIAIKNLLINKEGTHFTFCSENEKFDISLSLFGEHNVSNTLPAIFIALKFNLTPREICQSLKNITITDMRFEKINGIKSSLLINDAYNASPTSMKASLKTFFDLYNKEKSILILGDMFELGEQSNEMHESIGHFLNENQNKFHFLVTVGENSKNISKFFNSKNSSHFSSNEEALFFLQTKLKNHVLFFKASRGMKLEQIVNQLKTAE